MTVYDLAPVIDDTEDEGIPSEITLVSMAGAIYGDALRERLMKASRNAGGHGDVRINVLLSPGRSFAILRMLFLPFNGGVSCSVNPSDFNATHQWIEGQVCRGHPDITAAGDLCVLRRKMSQLDVLRVDHDAEIVFRSLKHVNCPAPRAVNVIG